MNERLEFIVDSPARRLDSFVAERCQISRSYAQKLIREGQVTVEGDTTQPSRKLDTGDRIVVNLTSPEPLVLTPEDIPLKIVYEDSDIVVVDKPAGLVAHPAAGKRAGTLVNAILAHCPDLRLTGDSTRPGIVHRLDRDTSGLMVVAKNDAAQTKLSLQFKERSIAKGYIGLVAGHLAPEQGAIEAPIGRHPKDRKRMAVVSGGREARTRYQVLRYLGDYTLVEAMPETGRTHQIRVHFAAIGHPVFGDPVYGKRSPLLGRQFLHACRLGFKLPSNDEFVEFKSELPLELLEVLGNMSDEGLPSDNVMLE
ncbi:RluA family pseudouridine synthase [Chloroflexota bacterium]